MRKWTSVERCSDVSYLHPDLRAKVPALLADLQGHFDPNKVTFRVFETGRSTKRQALLIANGTSRTKQSRHLNGEAVDIIPYVKDKKGKWQPTWAAIKGDDGRTWMELLTSSAAAHELNRVWFKGPNGRFVDGAHCQLPDGAEPW